MAYTPQSLEEKPYNLCLNCVHIGKNCDGPNFLTMDAERWSEWCRLRKDYLGWTNAYIAELAGISKVSVDRAISGNIKDMRITTVQAITKALVSGVGGSWGKYPCAMADIGETEVIHVDNPNLIAKLEKAESECRKLENTIETMKEEHRADMDYMKDQMAAKDKLLSERYDFLKLKDRVIKFLSTAIAVAVFIILAALIMDRLNPDMGFFWIDNISSVFENKNLSDIGLNNINGTEMGTWTQTRL